MYFKVNLFIKYIFSYDFYILHVDSHLLVAEIAPKIQALGRAEVKILYFDKLFCPPLIFLTCSALKSKKINCQADRKI